MGYSPYKLLNASELTAICKHIEAICTEWIAGWFSHEPSIGVRCFRAAEYAQNTLAENTVWMSADSTSGDFVALAIPAGLFSEFGGLLLSSQSAIGRAGENQHSEILAELSQRALSDLIFQIKKPAAHSGVKKFSEASAPSSGFWKAGSGASVVEVTVDRQCLIIAFDFQSVRGMLPSSAMQPAPNVHPLVKPADALDGGRVKLKILVGQAQLELALLQTIVVGDVIKLDKNIEEPLHVINSDGTLFCKGFLGCRDGKKSIQLVN